MFWSNNGYYELTSTESKRHTKVVHGTVCTEPQTGSSSKTETRRQRQHDPAPLKQESQTKLWTGGEGGRLGASIVLFPSE